MGKRFRLVELSFLTTRSMFSFQSTGNYEKNEDTKTTRLARAPHEREKTGSKASAWPRHVPEAGHCSTKSMAPKADLRGPPYTQKWWSWASLCTMADLVRLGGMG